MERKHYLYKSALAKRTTMDKTNYTVLSIVAIVAITAIVAIVVKAKGADRVPSIEEIALSADATLDVQFTGMVIASDSPLVVSEPAAGNRIDLNDDGVLNAKDSDILGLVIDRVQFCPRSKQCDITGDDIVDMQDLGALNARIVDNGIRSVSDVQQPAKRVPTADILAIATGATQ